MSVANGQINFGDSFRLNQEEQNEEEISLKAAEVILPATSNQQERQQQQQQQQQQLHQTQSPQPLENGKFCQKSCRKYIHGCVHRNFFGLIVKLFFAFNIED